MKENQIERRRVYLSKENLVVLDLLAENKGSSPSKVLDEILNILIGTPTTQLEKKITGYMTFSK